MSDDPIGHLAENLVLLEIVCALRARGLLTREDIAGALLRAEYTAELMDDDGKGLTSVSDLVRATETYWEKRLGLQGDLIELRDQRHQWILAGSPKKTPIDPDVIARKLPR